MKNLAFAFLALSLALAGCRSAYSGEPNEPGVRRAPPAAIEKIEKEPTPAKDALTNDPISTRDRLAMKAARKLEKLDDVVTDMKARCDEKSTCFTLDMGFHKLVELRANVVIALANLRNIEIGIDAGQQSLDTALSEFEIAVRALGVRVEELGPPRIVASAGT
jgi:hypothetical protein